MSEFFCVDSDADACPFPVSVVSSLVVASCDTEMCLAEWWERGSVELFVDFSVRPLCSHREIDHGRSV